jgi:hypothetical protein
MENNNVRTVENVRLGFIEQLLDVEELESKQAPCDGGGMTLFGKCHNHNETLLKDVERRLNAKLFCRGRSMTAPLEFAHSRKRIACSGYQDCR